LGRDEPRGLGRGKGGGRERGRGDKTVIIAEINQIHKYIWLSDSCIWIRLRLTKYNNLTPNILIYLVDFSYKNV